MNLEMVQQYLSALSQRERLVLIGGGLALLLLGMVFLWWLPMLDEIEVREVILADRLETIQWMEQSAKEVKRLEKSVGKGDKKGQKKKKSKEGSLLTIANKTARNGGLGEVLKRVEPKGKNQVRLWFEEAPFDKIHAWLLILRDEYGIVVSSINIDLEDSPGQVRARLVLSRTGAE
ncbi:MAG: type II secretion system protein M [Magnetococcales bacterium]|nr:type II secretion system protein M [Magnetococcales bacterium]